MFLVYNVKKVKNVKNVKKGCYIMYEKFLTSTEFANEIGVSVMTLKRWEDSGKLLPHHKTPGGRRYYSYSQIDMYKSKYFNNSVLEKVK